MSVPNRSSWRGAGSAAARAFRAAALEGSATINSWSCARESDRLPGDSSTRARRKRISESFGRSARVRSMIGRASAALPCQTRTSDNPVRTTVSFGTCSKTERYSPSASDQRPIQANTRPRHACASQSFGASAKRFSMIASAASRFCARTSIRTDCTQLASWHDADSEAQRNIEATPCRSARGDGHVGVCRLQSTESTPSLSTSAVIAR